jgi:hypothetical protein
MSSSVVPTPLVEKDLPPTPVAAALGNISDLSLDTFSFSAAFTASSPNVVGHHLVFAAPSILKLAAPFFSAEVSYPLTLTIFPTFSSGASFVVGNGAAVLLPEGGPEPTSVDHLLSLGNVVLFNLTSLVMPAPLPLHVAPGTAREINFPQVLGRPPRLHVFWTGIGLSSVRFVVQGKMTTTGRRAIPLWT